MTHKTGRSLSFYFYFIACFMVLAQGFPLAAPKYPLPGHLIGTTGQQDYDTWLENKSVNILKKDRRRNRACALNATLSMYKQEIHKAVIERGSMDPYTGDTLRWDLIHTWDSRKNKGRNDFEKQFQLLPTVDHKDPYSETIDFEICSWLINGCKSDQTPREFVALCKKIVDYRQSKLAAVNSRPLSLAPELSRRVSKGQPSVPATCSPSRSATAERGNLQPVTSLSCPQLYFLPSFLTGICTEATYRKWLFKRAWQLYSRDQRQGRPYARPGARVLYKQAIHAAVDAAGLPDPYTGDTMKWELIGTWKSTKGKDWPEGYIKRFYLMPTVDHIDPDADSLALEICSWRINECKSGLTPREFIEVCGRVKEYVK